MDALAQLVGVSKEAINKYEKGKAQPNSTNLIKLANALNVKPDYFFRSTSVELENVNFRKRGMGVKRLNQIREKVRDNLERYIELEELLTMDTSFPNPIGHIAITGEKDIETSAEILRKEWELGLDPVTNVIETLEAHEIKVVEMEGEEKFDGLSSFIDNKYPVIVINKNYPIERKRFTLLHELGHLLLTKNESSLDNEKVCHYFAGALLIPEQVVYEKFGKRRHNLLLDELIAIQQTWGISIGALIYRLAELNVISSEKRSTFFWKRNKSPEFKVLVDKQRFSGTEQSYRFNQLLYRGIAQELLSLSKASELSNISIHELKKAKNVIR